MICPECNTAFGENAAAKARLERIATACLTGLLPDGGTFNPIPGCEDQIVAWRAEWAVRFARGLIAAIDKEQA